MELSTYFRINAENTGQFERTLIIADDKSYVSYLEGCTAPKRDENQLHAAVVELVENGGKAPHSDGVVGWVLTTARDSRNPSDLGRSSLANCKGQAIARVPLGSPSGVKTHPCRAPHWGALQSLDPCSSRDRTFLHFAKASFSDADAGPFYLCRGMYNKR